MRSAEPGPGGDELHALADRRVNVGSLERLAAASDDEFLTKQR
jgi:hypothetical protein